MAGEQTAMLLEVDPAPLPQDLVSFVTTAFDSLQNEQNATARSLEEAFNQQFEENKKKYQVHLDQESSVNATLNYTSTLNVRLAAAVKHLRTTHETLVAKLHGLSVFAARLGGIPASSTSQHTSTAAHKAIVAATKLSKQLPAQAAPTKLMKQSQTHKEEQEQEDAKNAAAVLRNETQAQEHDEDEDKEEPAADFQVNAEELLDESNTAQQNSSLKHSHTHKHSHRHHHRKATVRGTQKDAAKDAEKEAEEEETEEGDGKDDEKEHEEQADEAPPAQSSWFKWLMR